MSFKQHYRMILNDYYSQKRSSTLQDWYDKFLQKGVALFGAAWIGQFICGRLKEASISPICFLDNFAEGFNEQYGIPIMKPLSFIEKNPDAYILITMDKAKPLVYRQLVDLGVSEDRIVSDVSLFFNPFTPELLEPHLDGYEWAYNFFSDDLSKNLILQRLRFYLLGTEIPFSSSPQYFEGNLFQLSTQEVFVDGGFFTGDTTQEFLRQTNGNYRMIYGFEPDEYVRKKIDPSLLNENLEIICAGLHSSNGVLSFATTSGVSRSSGGNIVGELDDLSNDIISIPTVSIDSFFSDKPVELQPTFVKMDIEGSEMSALKGAASTIKKYKPKLAICVYHKLEDIYELTSFIHDVCPSYHLTLRHYGRYMWESVLYAF